MFAVSIRRCILFLHSDKVRLMKIKMQFDFRRGKLYEIVLDFVEAGLGFLCGMCLAFTNAMPFEIPKMSNACLRYENTTKTANCYST